MAKKVAMHGNAWQLCRNKKKRCKCRNYDAQRRVAPFLEGLTHTAGGTGAGFSVGSWALEMPRMKP